MNIVSNPVQNAASAMKSAVDVGGRNKPVAKEPCKPSNADMEYASALVVKPGVSVGMAQPTAKPDQLARKEAIESAIKQKMEEALSSKMKKIQDINAAKNKTESTDEKEKVSEPVDKEKKNKIMNQKKIEELQKKLFDVQIRLKNTGRKVNWVYNLEMY